MGGIVSFDPYVFTITNRENESFFKLLESAEKFDIDLRVHFIGVEQDYWDVIARKHLLIKEILDDNYSYPEFLFLDALDTRFVAPLPEKVDYTKGGLFFGAEKNLYPQEMAGYKEYFPGEGMRYLNSGVIWGLKAQYRYSCPKYVGHDQMVWIRQYVNYLRRAEKGFSLDTGSNMVVNLHSTEQGDFARRDGKLVYLPTGSTPSILHANGKWPMLEL